MEQWVSPVATTSADEAVGYRMARQMALDRIAELEAEVTRLRAALTCHLCDWPRPIDLDRHWHAAHLARALDSEPITEPKG